MNAQCRLTVGLICLAVGASACTDPSTSPTIDTSRVQVSISPKPAIAQAGDTVKFTATVQGTDDYRVVWDIQDHQYTVGGELTYDGVFTVDPWLPFEQTPVHIIARSLADPSAADTSLLTLTLPPADIQRNHLAPLSLGSTWSYRGTMLYGASLVDFVMSTFLGGYRHLPLVDVAGRHLGSYDWYLFRYADGYEAIASADRGVIVGRLGLSSYPKVEYAYYLADEPTIGNRLHLPSIGAEPSIPLTWQSVSTVRIGTTDFPECWFATTASPTQSNVQFWYKNGIGMLRERHTKNGSLTYDVQITNWTVK